jgi:hypothetical protein
MYSSLCALLMSFSVITGVVDNPPEDLLSLGQTETILTTLKIDQSEDALIRLLGGQSKVKLDTTKLVAAVKMLREGKAKDRREAKKTLNAASADALPFFQKLLKDSDPEISETAKKIIMKSKQAEMRAKQSGMTDEVLKMLAIRRLTELKSEKAISAIEQLTNHKDKDLVREAKRAVSYLKGIKPQRLKRTIASKQALILIPADTGFAAVLDATEPGKAQTLKDYLETILKINIPGMNADMIVGQFHQFLPNVLTMVGNPQVDAVVLAVSSDIGVERNSGWAGFIFKGKYNLDKIKNTLQMSFEKRELDGHVYYSDKWGPSFCPVNDSTLIMSFGPSENNHMAPFLKALKNKEVPEKFNFLKDTSTKRLVAMGDLSKKQREVLSNEIKRDLERVAGRNGPETEAQKAFLKVGALLAETSSFKASYENKIVTIKGVLPNEEKAKKIVMALKDADEKMRLMLKNAPIPFIAQIIDTEKALAKGSSDGKNVTLKIKGNLLNMPLIFMASMNGARARAMDVEAQAINAEIEVEMEEIEEVELEEPPAEEPLEKK